MLPVFSKYHAGNVRMIRTLVPDLQPLFYEALIRLAVNGMVGRVTAALRTPDQQHHIYLQGRPWLPGGYAGPVVTNADFKNSFHCWGVAIDFCPFRKFGPFYMEAYDLEPQVAHLWSDIGIEHPWPANGRNSGFVDDPHFQYTTGLSIADFANGKRPIVPSFQPVYPSLPPESQAVLSAMRAQLLSQGVLPLTPL